MKRMHVLLLPLVLTSGVLTGCSTNQVVAEKPQYCHTSETIVLEDGNRVNSRTRVECTDDQIKRLFHTKSGMAPNCGTFTYWGRKGGQDVPLKGVSCQKPDGSWEIVNTNIR